MVGICFIEQLQTDNYGKYKSFVEMIMGRLQSALLADAPS